MSELRDSYIRMGHDPESLEKTSFYLRELASRSAIEVDNFFLIGKKEFSHTNELGEILGKYQLKDSDKYINNFPYMSLWEAIIKNSDKKIREISELALEMRLLRYELNEIPNLSEKRLEELTHFLCDLSKEFSLEYSSKRSNHRHISF